MGGSSRIRRVAIYGRVSTEHEAQLSAFENQQAWYEAEVQRHPDWSVVARYYDEGITGTAARKRPAFMQMRRDAKAGKFDLVVTREVCRFARNTVDTLTVTRELKDLGIEVYFIQDNIWTMDGDGELRLTIMATLAQEESRKISERTRWGQLQAMRRGVVFGNDSIYGYTLRGGRLAVEPEQADVVRRIYRAFLTERKGARAIARALTRAGVAPPLRSDGVWSANTVLGILRNEKYCGDLLQKKYRTTDHLTHRKVVNDGTEERFCLRDHHEAIVSRADFQAVQAELARRAGLKEAGSRFSARYWYSGKIRCGACGRSFALKRTRRADGTEYTRFVCRGRLEGTDACRMPAVRGEVLLAAVRAVWKYLSPDRPAMAAEVLRALEAPAPDGRETERLRQALLRQEGRRDRAVEAYLDGTLDRAELRRMLSRLEGETARLHGELAALEAEEMEKSDGDRLRAAKDLVRRELEGGEALLDELVRQVTVLPDCLLVEAAELPVRFRVRAVGGGTGKNYRVRVTECRPEPFREERQTAQ